MMADRMLHFPARSSSAIKPDLEDSAEEPIQPPATLARYRGLVLVKSDHLPADAAATPTRGSRLAQTRRIVAQVEQEIAAIAARRRAERFGGLHAMPVADIRGAERAARRDTPWAVLARLLRSLRRS
jgi:hypothetical protein